MFLPCLGPEWTVHHSCEFTSWKLTEMRKDLCGYGFIVYFFIWTTQLVIDPFTLYRSDFLSLIQGICTELCACSPVCRGTLFWLAVLNAWATYCGLFWDWTSSARICWVARCCSWSRWPGENWGWIYTQGFILWPLHLMLYPLYIRTYRDQIHKSQIDRSEILGAHFPVEICKLEAAI